MSGVFVDTNVLLYSYDISELAKHDRCCEWLDALWVGRRGRVSWQVINEFYANLIRKQTVSSSEARLATEEYCRWKPASPSFATLQRAWHWCDATQANFWDGLIVAAAEQSECRWLLSEDFQSGRKFGGVTVVNPFEHEPAEFDLQ